MRFDEIVGIIYIICIFGLVIELSTFLFCDHIFSFKKFQSVWQSNELTILGKIILTMLFSTTIPAIVVGYVIKFIFKLMSKIMFKNK